jgi:hypothetical protein
LIYKDLHASIMKFCSNFAVNSGATFVNFDNSWDEAELPEGDVCGYLGLSFELDDQFVSGTVQIGFSTKNDKNLFRLSNHIAELVELLRPTNKIRVYNADTGGDAGGMVIQNGTKVMPVSGSKSRPVQFIAVAFLTTVTYDLPSAYV